MNKETITPDPKHGPDAGDEQNRKCEECITCIYYVPSTRVPARGHCMQYDCWVHCNDVCDKWKAKPEGDAV